MSKIESEQNLDDTRKRGTNNKSISKAGAKQEQNLTKELEDTFQRATLPPRPSLAAA